jgi:hypothetical protein
MKSNDTTENWAAFAYAEKETAELRSADSRWRLSPHLSIQLRICLAW